MINLKVESADLSGSHLVMVIITILMCLAIEHSFLSNLIKKPGYVAWTQTEFIQAFTFLIDNIYVIFDDNIYCQTLGIPRGTDCAPLLADLYLYTYEYDFLDSLTKSKKLHIAKKFDFTFRYIDDIISINNKHFNTHISDISS